MSLLKRTVAVLLIIVIAIATFFTVVWIASDFGAGRNSVIAGVFFGLAALLVAVSAYFLNWGDDD